MISGAIFRRSLEWSIILYALFPQRMSGQNMVFVNSPIPVMINDEMIDHPFFGGFNTPRIQFSDWDNDGDQDLFLLDEDGFMRYYRNDGSAVVPDFKINTARFQDLPPAAWFYFADMDDDGFTDLMMSMVSESGHIRYYQHTPAGLIYHGQIMQPDGTPVINNPFMTPTFADIDNDGDVDFFTGNFVGTVTYYENTGWNEDLPVFEFITASWQNISIISNLRHGACALQFIDLDGDEDYDLSWGDYYHQSLYIIWNIGTPDFPVMDIFNITEEYPPQTPVITAGQNMPGFVDLDGDMDADLIISVLSGAFGTQLINNLYYYENTGSASAPDYQYITNHFLGSIDLLTDAAPELADIDNDGDLDLFIGNGFEPTSFPWTGRLHFFRNTGTISEPEFVEEDPAFLGTSLGNNVSPVFGDIDSDNDLDVFVGNSNGFLLFFRNTGTPESYNFSPEGLIESIDLSGNSSPELADLDNDGDLDLICGESSGIVTFHENIGSEQSFLFHDPVMLQDSVITDSKSTPAVFDFDGDGDFDLFTGSGQNGGSLFLNEGSPENYFFVRDTNMVIPDLGLNTSFALGSLTGEDHTDVLVGISTGGLYHLSYQVCVDGDMNTDGNLDILDIVMLADWILSSAPPPDTDECSMDLNNDMQLDILDIIIMVTQILEG